MKKLLLNVGIIFLMGSVNAQPIYTESNIEQVTVYTQGAGIYRQARVQVPRGKQEIVIQGLSNVLNLQSLQVTVPNEITLLSASFKTNFVTPKELTGKIAEFTDSVESLQLRVQLTVNKQEALRQEQDLLLQNKQVGGSQSGLDPEKLKQMAAYYNQRLPELKNQITRIGLVIKDLQEKLNRFQNQLNDLNQDANRPFGEVVLQVISDANIKATIDLSYIVRQAGWVPSYDIRAEDISTPLNLTYKAKVYQNSGVDWVQVPLTISTGNPVISHTRPVLHPWYLSPMDQRSTYKAEDARNLAYEEQAVEMDNAGAAYSGVDEYTQVQENQLNVEFQVDLPYTIPSDNKQHTVAMKDYSLPANYKYHAVPKLDKNAFLLAKVTDWNRLNLLPGNANIFFENKYIGQVHLNPNVPSDTMLISLGRDQSIIVERVKQKDFHKKSFIGNKVKESFVYEISIRNNKNREVSVEILDHLPVSQNDQISVDLEEKSGARYDEKSGKLVWDVKLSPGETRDFTVEFTVKYPEGWYIPGL